MSDPIIVDPKAEPPVVIPADCVSWRAVRSGGPGGQNVNKVASKVELRVDVGGITGLTESARGRLAALCAGKLDSSGRILVTSQRTRDQSKNLEDAREKVAELVRLSLVIPKRRRATRPSAGSRERRIDSKKREGEKKRTRSRQAAD